MAVDYASLQAEVADWLERVDLNAQIKTFIRYAEIKMNDGLAQSETSTARLRVDEMKVEGSVLFGKTDDGVVRDNVPHPADFLELREIRATGTWTGNNGAEVITPLSFLHMERISNLELMAMVYRQVSVVSYGRSDGPYYFSNNATADAWNIFPQFENWEITYAYWQTVPALSDVNTTNKILARYPDVYLYGALESAEAFLRLKDTNWRDRFISSMNSANSTTRKAAWSGSDLRTKSPYSGSRVMSRGRY